MSGATLPKTHIKWVADGLHTESRVPMQAAGYRGAMTYVAVPAEALLDSPFQLRSLSPALTPSGSEGTWYRYEIVQGTSMITGLRSGSAAEVGLAVHAMVDRLNERRAKASNKKPKPKPKRTGAPRPAPGSAREPGVLAGPIVPPITG